MAAADVFPDDDSIYSVTDYEDSMMGGDSGMSQHNSSSCTTTNSAITNTAGGTTMSDMLRQHMPPAERADVIPIETAAEPFSVPTSHTFLRPDVASKVIQQQQQRMRPFDGATVAVKELRSIIDASADCDTLPADGKDTQSDDLTQDVPWLEMIEEPEESYRARYESEGCKGPLRGMGTDTFPTVKVVGYVGDVVLTVFLVTKNGEPHLHSVNGPGSTKAPCKDVTLPQQMPGIQMLLGPEQDMTAVWDSLSIRRTRNWEADKLLKERGKDPRMWKNKRKEARLMFQVTIPQSEKHLGYILVCQSKPFLCTAPAGSPEIWWCSLLAAPASGGQEMGIIGKKFSSGFKIRFYESSRSGKSWEALAEVDQRKSHQGACVLKVPQYMDSNITSPVEVSLEVRVGSERDPRCSEPVKFTYLPCQNNLQQTTDTRHVPKQEIIHVDLKDCSNWISESSPCTAVSALSADIIEACSPPLKVAVHASCGGSPSIPVPVSASIESAFELQSQQQAEQWHSPHQQIVEQQQHKAQQPLHSPQQEQQQLQQQQQQQQNLQQQQQQQEYIQEPQQQQQHYPQQPQQSQQLPQQQPQLQQEQQPLQQQQHIQQQQQPQLQQQQPQLQQQHIQQQQQQHIQQQHQPQLQQQQQQQPQQQQQHIQQQQRPQLQQQQQQQLFGVTVQCPSSQPQLHQQLITPGIGAAGLSYSVGVASQALCSQSSSYLPHNQTQALLIMQPGSSHPRMTPGTASQMAALSDQGISSSRTIHSEVDQLTSNAAIVQSNSSVDFLGQPASVSSLGMPVRLPPSKSFVSVFPSHSGMTQSSSDTLLVITSPAKPVFPSLSIPTSGMTSQSLPALAPASIGASTAAANMGSNAHVTTLANYPMHVQPGIGGSPMNAFPIQMPPNTFGAFSQSVTLQSVAMSQPIVIFNTSAAAPAVRLPGLPTASAYQVPLQLPVGSVPVPCYQNQNPLLATGNSMAVSSNTAALQAQNVNLLTTTNSFPQNSVTPAVVLQNSQGVVSSTPLYQRGDSIDMDLTCYLEGVSSQPQQQQPPRQEPAFLEQKLQQESTTAQLQHIEQKLPSQNQNSQSHATGVVPQQAFSNASNQNSSEMLSQSNVLQGNPEAQRKFADQFMDASYTSPVTTGW